MSPSSLYTQDLLPDWRTIKEFVNICLNYHPKHRQRKGVRLSKRERESVCGVLGSSGTGSWGF